MLEREQLIAVVQGVQRGDEAAFSDLYEHHKQDIYFHILKTVEDPELAADLTQDAFMEILEGKYLQEKAEYSITEVETE